MMELDQIFRASEARRKKPLKDAFFKIDQHSCFEYISQSLLKLVQTDDSHQLIGKNIWEEFPALVQTDFYKNIATVVDKKRTICFEYHVKSLLVWYRVQIEPTGKGVEVFFNDITSLKETQQHEGFLNKANTILASSLEYDRILTDFARLCTDYLSDWCIVDLLDDDAKVKRMAVSCYDSSQDPLAVQLRQITPATSKLKYPIAQALYQGKPVMVRLIDEKTLEKLSYSKEHAALLQRIGPKSAISVPLMARNRIIGALTLLNCQPHRCFNQRDLQFAQEVASKVALHVDNAQLYYQVKNTNLQLEESRRRLYNLIMETPAAICLLTGPDHVFELVNSSHERLFPKANYKGKALRSLPLNPAFASFLALLDDVYENDRKFIGKNYPMILPLGIDGSPTEAYFNFTYQPTHDDAGKVNGVLVFGIDVTDQVKARQILERGKDRVQTILSALPQTTWTVLPDGHIEYYKQPVGEANPADSQTLQHLWRTIVHPKDLQRSLAHWQQALLLEQDLEIEHRIRQTPRHAYRWHLTRATPVRDVDGQLTLWVGSGTDIDDQKTAYDHLVATRKELNNSNALLIEKNKDLERINSDLDSFVYAASHDLKAPVSNIEGLTNMLIKGLEAEQIKDSKIYTALGMIDFSIKKFKTTLQDLTDITKLNKDVYDDVALVDLNEIVEEVIMMIADMIREANAKININVYPHHMVRFSYANLKSLMYNLISNAVKYRHPDRQPVIDIRTSAESGQWILTVSDNGLGIASKYKNKVFNMFKRLHTDIEGTGMGLFLVKRIVDKAGGDVRLDSELDKGSSFSIILNQSVK